MQLVGILVPQSQIEPRPLAGPWNPNNWTTREFPRSLLEVVYFVQASLTSHSQIVKKKNLPANAGDPGLIPGSGRSSVEGHGNPLQYSCLENPISMDRGAWQSTVHGVAKSWT